MPSKKKKYNARFPPARIKKIMQTDEEVGKVAAAVPVIISRALELFVESLLQKTSEVTKARNAKTLTTSHMKQCIFGEPNFDFLKELVVSIPDNQEEDNCNSPAPTGEQSNFNLARRAHRPGSSGSRGGAGSSSRSQTQDFSDDDDDIDEDLPDGSDNAIQSPEIKDEPIYLDLTKSDCNDEKPPAIKPERPTVIHPPIIQNFPGFYASNLNQCDDYDT